MTKIWTEIWSRPGDASFGRVIDDPGESEGSFHDGLNQIGDGTLRIPNRFTGFDSILKSDPDTPANSVSSLVRVFSEKDPDTPIFEWLPGNLYPATSKDDPTVEVAGKGIKSILSYARLEPYDWDGSDDFAPLVPDWSYGGVNILKNPGFETVPFPNGGFENGTNEYWNVTQPDGFLTAGVSLLAVNNPAGAQAGDWYGLVNPGNALSGAVRTFSGLVVGSTYTITGYMNDPTASGDRFRAGVAGAATATHTNAYEADGYWWAEVGNAAMGGGASDGTWQSFTLTFEAAESSIQLVILYDDAGAGPNFRIDSWSITGDGVGLFPWTARYPDRTNVFEYQTAVVHSGVGAAEVQGNDQRFLSPYGLSNYGRIGIQQPLSLKVGSPYVASVWVRQDSGSNQEMLLAILRESPIGPEGSPLSLTMAASVVSVPTATWTKLEIPFTADVTEAFFYVSWRYAGAFDDNLHASPTYYVDDAELFEGLPRTSFGDIFTQIYDHAINADLRTPIVWDDGSATDTPYLTLDFDDALDSAGAAWDNSDIAIKLTMRMSYSQIMAEFARGYGYEYRIVPDDVELGTWKMQAYNPGTMSVDYTAAASPAIQGGSSDVRRSIRRFVPGGTNTLVEGLGRVTGRAANAGLVTALGRIESARISREAPDLTAAADAADASIAAALTGSEALSYVLAGTLQDEPLSAYIIGDLLTVEDPPEVSTSGRLVDVVCSYTPSVVEWETQFGSAIIVNPQAVVANAVAGLLSKFEYPFPEGGGVPTAGEGAGGESTLLVAASDAPSSSITKADLVCTGTDDQDVIMSAMLEIYSAGGGRLRLSPGTFNITADSVIVGYSVGYELPIIMQGEGEATILNVTDAPSSWGAYVTTSSRIRDIKIQGASMGTGQMIQVDGQAEHILLGTAGAPIGIELGTNARCEDIIITGAYTGGDVVAGANCEVSGVRNSTGASYAVVYVTGSETNVSGVRSSNSVAGCAVRAFFVEQLSLSDIQSFQDENGIILDSVNWWTANGIHVRSADAVGVVIEDCGWGVFDGVVDQCGQHGLTIVGASSNKITGQFYANGADANDTYDNINISGASNRNFITGANLRPRESGNDTRYGVNVGGTGECNMVVGNDFGDASDYGINAFNDTANNTQIFWPADATYGDNFTDCGSGS